ncbi:hypothetical protein [Butyrivibrio sp. FC2001]|uniref:hypothetical protein n=1 Tax=Butyrivibrio sp. FC2001 TaxID=1280671 RepID=UPI0003F75B0C|nr:hypothetical protein [Butyrivibrio sp. FC2001]
MYKKILVYFMVLTMALSMSACGSKKNSDDTNSESSSAMSAGKLKAGTTASDVKVEDTAEEKKQSTNPMVGYYKIIKFISEGEDITEELHEMESMGSSIYLIVREDGTGYVSMLGENTDFDWNDKIFTMHDADMGDTDTPYTFKDGQITLAADNTEMVFVAMTEDEVKAFDNGESNKTVDQITDELLDNALGEAMDDATKQLDEAASEAGEEIDKAAEDASKAIEEAKDDAAEEIESALTDGKDAITGSLSGGLSGSHSNKKGDSGNTSSKFDSSYLPDLSGGKHINAGYYEIMAFQENGTTYSKGQLKNAGVDFDMMLCPDGKGYAHFIGTYYDLSWDDGSIYVATDEGQEKMIYFVSDYDGKNVITISDSSMAMVFEYVKEADPTYEWAGNSGLMPN